MNCLSQIATYVLYLGETFQNVANDNDNLGSKGWQL